MASINEVQEFIEKAFQMEYDLSVESCKNSNQKDFVNKVYDFYDEYLILSAEPAFNSLTEWRFNEPEDYKKDYLENILCNRKIFAIAHSEEAIYDRAIANVEISGTLFTCYASDNNQDGNNKYAKRYFVSTMEDKPQIIGCEQITSQDGWKDFQKFIGILDYGKKLEVKKIQTPLDDEDLKHYNAL